jgi:hypothetical protein
LVANSGNGNLTQTGPLTVVGNSDLTAGTGDITLSNAGNNFTGAVSSSGNDVALTDATGGIVLGATNTSGTLNVASTGGAISQLTPYASSNAITTAGAASFSAANGSTSADVALSNPDNRFGGTVSVTGAKVTLVDSTPLNLGTVNSTGDLTVTGTGGLTQTGPLTVVGNSHLTAGTGDITLTNAGNNFGGTVSATAANVTLVDSTPLNLGTVTTTGDLTVTGTGGLDLGTTSVGGQLVANSGNGNMTQSGPLTVVGNADLTAGTGDITLSNAGNNFGGTVSASGHNIALTDASGGVVLGTLNSTGTLAVLSTGGDITQAANTHILVAGPASFTATTGGAPGTPADILLSGTGNDFAGPVSVSGKNIVVNDSVGDLLLNIITATGNFTASATGTPGNIGQTATSKVLVSGQANLTSTHGAVSVTVVNPATADSSSAGNASIIPQIAVLNAQAVQEINQMMTQAGWGSAAASDRAILSLAVSDTGGSNGSVIGGGSVSGDTGLLTQADFRAASRNNLMVSTIQAVDAANTGLIRVDVPTTQL